MTGINRFNRYIGRSLSRKLSLWIVLFAALIFLISLGFMFSQSLRTVRQEAINRATQVLDNTTLRVNSILQKVEIAADNTDWLVMRHLDTPDSLFVYSRQILQNNPDLNGCSISFEPYYFRDRGLYFSAFSLNDNGVIKTTQEGNDHYEYFYMDWYLLPKLLDRPVWTEPYFDFNPVDIYSTDMIASYCKPLKDEFGIFIGSLSVDISLDWLSNTISAVKPYPNSYSIMIGEGGTYFVHPDKSKLLYQTIFTETMENPDPALTELGHAMLRGEEGMRQLVIDGAESYVFFEPLGHTGWSVAIVCPASDIFSGYTRLKRIVVGIVLFGLLLMLLVFIRIVSRELEPLKELATQTGTIAEGHFDQTLPDVRRSDEIGQLSQSFGNMQQSLMKYIEELKQTTALTASLENELKVASDIQMSMLPRVFPDHKGLDLYASMSTAKEVGGDLYGYVMHGEQLYFCVGDVSGKGVPASLFMAQSAQLFRVLAAEGMTPSDIATYMNNELSENNDTNMFVTMFIGLLHIDSGKLDFCNCGHNAPVLDGKFMDIKHANLPLGLFKGFAFESESIADIRDKMMFIYTDGLNEAENPAKELFGDDAILKELSGTDKLTSREVIDKIIAAVENHRQGEDPNDDMTLMCFKLSKTA
jgi:sigma-B regulation protein RsbU (phosphoserine phosphatase)